MISSLQELSEVMKLAFMARAYPTPESKREGNGSVAEIAGTYSQKCIIKAAEALSDVELEKVILFSKEIMFHNNASNGHFSNGADRTIKYFLERNGSSKLVERIKTLSQAKKPSVHKPLNALQELALLLNLDEFAIKFPCPTYGTGGNVAEIGNTYSWSCVINAAESLSDQKLSVVLKSALKISFHNNSNNGHTSIGSSWTLKYFLEYNGSREIKLRIKSLKSNPGADQDVSKQPNYLKIIHLSAILKLNQHERKFPTPAAGSGKLVVEMGRPFSVENLCFSAQELSDIQLKHLFEFQAEITSHSNDKSLHGPSGSSLNFSQFLIQFGDEELKKRITSLLTQT